MNPHVLLYSLILLMVMCWSGNYVVAKTVFREIPPSLVMALRTTVSGALMVPIFWRQRSKLVRDEVGLLLLLGLGGVTLNQFLWTLGAARTTVVHSSMIVGTAPIWVLLIAAMMGLEQVTLPKIGGMLMAMTGIFILQIFRTRSTTAAPTVLGDVLVFASALVFAAMTAIGKRYRPRSGPVTVTACAYIAGSVVCAPLYLISTPTFNFSQVTPGAWVGVLYMGAISSVTGYLIYYYALERITASRIAAFQYLQPVLASGMALLFLGEAIALPAVFAGAIIIAGVVVTERFG